MNLLKQSTAYTFRLGPFVDSTDGDTEENALTIAYTDVLLSKAGGALAAKAETTALTGTGANAHYTCILNTTDTGTVGTLRVWCHVSGALPVWKDFVVVPANVYDSIVSGTDLLDVNTSQLGGTAQTGNDVGADVDAILVDTAVIGAPAGADIAADIAAVKSDSAAILADTGTDGVVIAAGGITAAKFAAGAIDAAALAADAGTEIAAAVLAAVCETEGSYTVQQILSVALSVLAGVTSSSGATLKTPNGVATRVAATIDASSNRTAMTLTPSA